MTEIEMEFQVFWALITLFRKEPQGSKCVSETQDTKPATVRFPPPGLQVSKADDSRGGLELCFVLYVIGLEKFLCQDIAQGESIAYRITK